MNQRIFVAAVSIIFGATVVRADKSTQSIALPAIEQADYDMNGRFRVNGKSFFPILLYDAPTDQKTLAELRDFGFNTLTCKPEACDALRAAGFYGAVHSAKKVEDASSIFLVLGTDSPALYFKKNLLLQTAEANAKSKAAVPNRPHANAIGYWEDEPEGVVAGKLPSKAVYEELVDAIDVSAPYLYPVPYQPVASVGEAVSRARAATGGAKPILPILQLFAWDAKARYPTPAELRCMTYLALVEGASGIGYYSYGHVTGQPKKTIAEVQPELWKSVKQLNREVAEIGPALFADDTKPSLFHHGDGSPVKSRAAKGGLPAVFVNPTSTKQELRLAESPEWVNARMFDGRTLRFDAGVAFLTLQPLEVIVLRAPSAR